MATYRDPYFRLNAFEEPVIPCGLTEVRTHGVNGAPPEQLLNDPHPILVRGDATAAFYRSHQRPSGPLERTVEAYSWTGLNSRAGSRAFWLLLFPFGMVNFAGWLVPVRWPAWASWTRGRIPLARGLIRLLGLAFTVHYALWAMVMAVDLLAVQCGEQQSCYGRWWLGWFRDIRDWLSPAARMVVFTVVPLVIVGVLWRLGRRSAQLYDRYWATTDCDPDSDDTAHFGLVDDLSLRQPEFWQTAYFIQLQAMLHVSAAVATVGAVLAWTLARVGTAPSRTADLGALGWGLAAMAAAATLAAVLTGALSHRRPAGGHPYREWRWPVRLLLLISLVLVAAVGRLGWDLPVGLEVPLPGLRNTFGGVLVAELVLLLVLSFVVDVRLGASILAAGILLYRALKWDQPLWWRGWGWLGAATVIAVAAVWIYRRRFPAGSDPDLDPARHLNNPFWIFVGLAAVMLVTVLGWRAEQASWWLRAAIAVVPIAYLIGAFAIQIRHGHDYPPSWRLRGGGLAALAAVGAIALTIVSAAAIVFAADRLGHAYALLPTHEAPVDTAGKKIYYPGELGWIASAALAPLIIFVLALATRILSLWWFRWLGQVSTIHKEFEQDPERLRPGRVDLPAEPPKLRRRIARRAAWARLFGSLVDDADWLVSAAVVTMLAGGVSLALDLPVVDLGVLNRGSPTDPPDGLKTLIGFSSWALGFLALGAIWLVQKARTDTGLRRAVGIVWEVASFFPRRFHPLAPPSYAERSVPELRGRLIDLTTGGQVLLVAHSQGTLVSVAALLTLLDNQRCRPRLGRIAFISYGCMLRRLFGRAYSLAVRQADLIALKAELERDQEPLTGDAFPCPPAGRPPYWMNFGRHSDYLGGRVFTDLQPPPHSTPQAGQGIPERPDDVFFGDPTRRWSFRGQPEPARLWRHSFDYLDDSEDTRFAGHVARVVHHLLTRPTSGQPPDPGATATGEEFTARSPGTSPPPDYGQPP